MSSVAGYVFKTEAGKSNAQVTTWYNRALKTDLTQIQLYVYGNSSSFLSFPGAVASSSEISGDGSACGFPPTMGQPAAPSCLESFLGGWHPQPEYDHVYLIFTVYGNIEDLPQGSRTALSEGAIDFFIWTYDRCDQGGTRYYHSLDSKVLSLTSGSDGTGYFITKTENNKWLVEVVGQNFEATEWYCEITQSVNPKNGKVTTTSTRHEPLMAVIPLSYSVEVVKNPN